MARPKFQFTLNDVIKEKKVSRKEVRELKQWMPTVNLPKVSDEMIATFIVACERDLESTKKTIISYFRITKSSPEIFSDKDVDREDLRTVLDILQVGSMPVRTDDDCVVNVSRIVDYRYYKFQLDPTVKLFFMMNDLCLNAGTPPRGLIILSDMKGFGLMHLSRIRMKTFRTIIDFFQEGVQLNLIALHMMNTAYVVDKLIFMVKPFMKSELFNKLHFHKSNVDMEEFYKNHIPKKCLPMEYGGDLPSLEELHQKTIRRFEELKDFFESEKELMKDWTERLNKNENGYS